jgi:hypothetical protein
LSVSPVPETRVYVKVPPPSGSVVVNAPTVVPVGWFSSTLDGDSAMSVGNSLTSLIVIVNCFANVPPAPSSVWMRTL